jgi:Transaldolase/Fructose-6-phosphate aldolase
MPSKLDQLKAMTTVVADTGDVDAIRRFGAVDATTNPTLILKAAHMPNHARLLEETVCWGRERNRLTSEITDRLALNFGLGIGRGRSWPRIDGSRRGSLFRYRGNRGQGPRDHRRIRSWG